MQRMDSRSRIAMARVVCLLSAAMLCGCKYFIIAGYLLGGPPSIEPDYDIETGQSMTDKDVKVAIVCFAPTEVRMQFSRIDKELTRHLAQKMFEHRIQVVNPDQVFAWLDRHPKWETPAEIGAATGATHVVYLELTKFSLYEEHSHSKLYRGRAEVLVNVWEMDADGHGEQIYTNAVTSVYPLAVQRSVYDTNYIDFKRDYEHRLSEEIGRLFYEHYNGDDIPDAT